MSDYSIKYSQLQEQSLHKIQKTLNIYEKSFDLKKDFKVCFDVYHAQFLSGRSYPFSLEQLEIAFKAKDFWQNLDDCGSWLEFREYSSHNQTKLHTANFCKKDRLCPACAVRRAYKQQNKFLNIYESKEDFKNSSWYYIVLPVKHSIKDSFEDVFKKIENLKKQISKSIRDKTMNNFFSQFGGGMFSVETTYSNNGWNVHLNLLINAPKCVKIDLKSIKNRKGQVSYQNDELGLFMIKYADNSLMHNIQSLDFSTLEDLKSSLVEVLKYSLKFSSLNKKQLLEFYIKTYRKRLFGTFGNLWGLGIDDVVLDTDDVLSSDFVEIIFARSFTNNSYSLKSIKEVSLND